jgi:hypothetical protein
MAYKIVGIRRQNFDWDEWYGGSYDLGFIDEDVMKQFPEIVAKGPDNFEYVTRMDYNKITPVLLYAIKE